MEVVELDKLLVKLLEVILVIRIEEDDNFVYIKEENSPFVYLKA
jgi:hypothetical protein